MADHTPPTCGSVVAYNRHRRLGEPVDQECQEANASYKRERRAALAVPRDPMVCRRCGVMFIPKRIDNGGACSQSCSNVLNQRKLRPVIEPRACLNCEAVFTPKHFDAQGCSQACRGALVTFKRHGITAAEYRAMLAKQGCRCLICGDALGDGRRDRHIDHDHATGKVRGILCPPCNLMLGHARDTPEILIAAARYLASG